MKKQYEAEMEAALRRYRAEYQLQLDQRQSDLKEKNQTMGSYLRNVNQRLESEVAGLKGDKQRLESDVKRLGKMIDALETKNGQLLNRERLMQRRRELGNFGVDGVEEMETEALEPSVLERLQSELACERGRVGDLTGRNQSLDRTILSENKRREDEVAVTKLHAAEAQRLAVAQEQRSMMTRIENMQREFDQKMAAVKLELNRVHLDQEQKSEQQLRAMHEKMMVMEREWSMEKEQLQDALEDANDALVLQRTRDAKDGVAPKKSTTDAGTDPVVGVEDLVSAVTVTDDMTSTMSITCHRRLVASERLCYTREKLCREETAKFLEIERAKVQELEQKLATGLESISNGMIAAAKKRATEAEKSAKEQAVRAAKAQSELADVKREMEQRMEGAKAMLGDTYKAYEESQHHVLVVHGKFNTAERVAAECKKQMERANESKRCALRELKEVKQKLETGPIAADLDDLVKALQETELNCQNEAALRRDWEKKFAQLEINNKIELNKVAQLREAYNEASGRCKEMSAIMRSGLFRF
jgi:hypothetical protein